jgi:hypothetical protein
LDALNQRNLELRDKREKNETRAKDKLAELDLAVK